MPLLLVGVRGERLGAGDDLFVAAPPAAVGKVVRGPRVGVAFAGRWAARHLRFAVADHPAVSRPAPRGPGGGGGRG